MRTRRIENEWLLLKELEQANSSRLQAVHSGDSLSIKVDGFPALLNPPMDLAVLSTCIRSVHNLRIAFPRYYPTMPAELYLDDPVFHPNVHPDTGFVCLWTKHRVQTTLEQTLAQLQRVLSWNLLNAEEEHVVQPQALRWYQQPGVREHLPLQFTSLTAVHPQSWSNPSDLPLRRRLS